MSNGSDHASAEDTQLRLFNTSILGTPVDSSVVLLRPKTANGIDPIYVQVDVKYGKYSAATVAYPPGVPTSQVRSLIAAAYRGGTQVVPDVWRLEKERFVVALQEDERETRILYLAFQPTEEVIRSMVDAGVLPREALPPKADTGETSR